MKVVAPDLDAYAKFLMEKVLALPVVVNVQSSFVLAADPDGKAVAVEFGLARALLLAAGEGG